MDSGRALPTGRGMTPRTRDAGRFLSRVLLTAAGYFICARLGYTLALPGGVVALWPASGLMLGLLLASPRSDWPALVVGGVVGSLTSDLSSGYHVGFAVAAASANATETLVAAAFATWRLARRFTLTALRDVGDLVGRAAVLSNSVTALLGAMVLHYILHVAFRTSWFVWWIGDGLGMLIVAPVVIAAARASFQRARGTATWLEIIAGFTLLIVVGVLALGTASDWTIRLGLYVILPLVLWAALRVGPGGAAVATLTIAAIATWCTALGLGPFATGSQSGIDAASRLYAFLGVVSLTSLVTSAVHAERGAAANGLRESESRYRSVVDAATDAIITFDENGVVQLANPAVERIFGYAPDELVGEKLTMLMPAETAEPHIAGLNHYRTTGERRLERGSVTVTGRHRNGADVSLEASFGERVENGRPLFTGVLRDVSEQQAAKRALDDAEARMRFAMEASRVGTWEVSFATGVSRWSDMLEVLHGIPVGSFGGTLEAFLERIHPEDRASVKGEIERATREHTDSNILYRTVWPDGSVHWISGVGRTFYDEHGAPVRSAGIGLDVTERRALEEQYRQSQKMEAIGQLAGGVAHDFNNLLTVIRGFGSMLAESIAPGTNQHDEIKEILRAADRAAALTRQLLAFSRRQVLAPRPLMIAESLRTVEPMLRRLIGEHIDFVVRANPDVGQIVADPGQIEQVVMNLCVNARDAMPDGGTLVVEVTNVDLGPSHERRGTDLLAGSYVMLSVTDNGVGMDAATTSRIFEPFFTTKGPGKGTGLGLSTIHGIVQQSGGTITVFSQPGQGSTFRAYFPRADDATARPLPRIAARPRSGSETVLIAEDDAALRKMAVRVLETAGYRVLAAGTPRKAVALARIEAGAIDLLLTDVVMPEMSGRSLAEHMSAMFPKLRVLYMSGYTDDAVVRRGILAHETQFIQKPFAQEDLLIKVREVLDQPRQIAAERTQAV